MIGRSSLTTLILAGALLAAATLPSRSQESGLRSTLQLDEVLAVPRGGAEFLAAPTPGVPRTASKRITIRQWIVDSGQNLVLPVKGAVLVELKAGELTTVIGNSRQERREGEFWTVPDGATMRLETEDDAAILETTAVSDSQ